MANVAFADTVVNDVTTAGEIVVVTKGGSAVTAGWQIIESGTDPTGDRSGCNVGGGDNAATMTPAITPPSAGSLTGVAVPAAQTVTACNAVKAFSFSATAAAAAGDYAVTVEVTGGKDNSRYSYAGAPFTLRVVNPPPTDTTPPVITPTITGTQGTNNWYTSNVALSWSIADAQSAISSSSGCDTVNITADQGETIYTCTATSAGGTESASRTITRDATAPAVTPASVNDTTWRRTSLAQAFLASDAMSGLANPTDASFTLTASTQSTKDGDGNNVATSVSKTVTDAAGNSTTRTVSALIDLSAPVISGSNVTDTPWRNTPLTHSFTASDALSGLASSTDASFNLTASAESVDATTPTTVSKTVADVAGNSSTRSVSALIDLTKPTSEVAGVTEGTVYFAAPTVTCPANDGLSDVRSAGMPSGNSSSVGAKSVTCNGAVDNAGNVQTTASTAVNYVLAPIGSFNSNFDGSAVLKVKPNQAIPLKWAFSDGTTNYAALSTGSLSSVSSARCSDVAGQDGTEIASETAAGASGLQLLPDNSYQMNWKATSTTGCRALTMTMNFAAGGSTSRTILVNIVK